jgi:phage major head subunit gpT-like protein
MIINAANIELAFKGFKAVFGDAYAAAPVYWDKVAMKVSSTSRDESYGWLGQFPQMREWLSGEREVKQLEAFGYAITNRKFESTIGITRDDFADDKLGLFKPMFAEMGHTARQHPDTLIFPLLAAGFASLCYDGQYFFDTDHPIPDEDGPIVGGDGRNYRAVSNMQAGAGAGWYLLDTTRAIRPIIWQEREGYQFTQVTRVDDDRVFMTDQYLYGIRARVNAGYGLWQLAFGSKAELTVENYVAARTAMMSQKGDKGRVLGVTPNVLVVPPALEHAARLVLKATEVEGSTNVWANTADLIVSPYL